MKHSLRVLALAVGVSIAAPAWADNPCAGKPTQAEFRACVAARQAELIAADRARLGVPDTPATLGPNGGPREIEATPPTVSNNL